MRAIHESVNGLSSPESKIALFRSLFQGRDDVYPRRFESRRTGQSGYQPACAREWAPGICGKPKIRCAHCAHREFLPVTDEVIRQHLLGRDGAGRDFVMGVYPMLRDESCRFLAVDFDKDHWREDAIAYLESCRRLDVPAALERSRSGNGGHVWIFFDEPVPAGLARRLGTHILTETMETRPDVGLDSYDRFFPNQDTLPQGGFGNLIALPLQKGPRERGNSVFLDERGLVRADQWAFLAAIARLERSAAEAIVRDGERRGRIVGVRTIPTDEDDAEPWAAPASGRPRERPIAGPRPKSLDMLLADQIYIAKASLTPALENRLVRLAAFQNPEFHKAQAMRLPTHAKPRIIGCAEMHAHHIGLPRGCLEDVGKLCADLGIALVVRDERCAGAPLDVVFQGELRAEQRTAARRMLEHEIGVLAATTAFGKTVVAAWLIAQRRVNTLILVHRRQLQEQWVERLSAFLGVPARGIGRVGGGRMKRTGSLDVAVIQSMIHKGVVDDCVGEYGHLVVDECHHLSARSFERVVRRAKSRFVTGLSATVARKDGHHPIIFMQCGPVRHRVDAKAQAAARPFSHSVHVRPTSFHSVGETYPDMRVRFQRVYRELVEDDERNRMIRDDVLEAVREGRSPLVLTERNDHLDRLASDLSPRVAHCVVLRGGTGSREARAVAARLAAIPANEDRVVLATGRYIGEGFDDARLDTLFLTLPVSWRGTIAQYVGRLHRLSDGKREVRVFDYADLNVPMLSRMFDRRCRGYEAIGYAVLLPAGAVPGWPADVPLPVDPRWKQEYASTVRRLVRDGVDAPLANLFAAAVREPPPGAGGVARARSASEAFLFRRLETLRETAGRFELNATLPIPFDGWGRMEVDFLCRDARIAVEIDGDQHLADVEAYRRDRRKDFLLQQFGHIVLRFLARDVGARLDAVLDAILQALSRRNP
ncbi:MAG: DUF559 domain-containing protein [Planctomycetes bacterium]|nr:DUF559 domain-containing protein [Planctomycetota bacterium]